MTPALRLSRPRAVDAAGTPVASPVVGGRVLWIVTVSAPPPETAPAGSPLPSVEVAAALGEGEPAPLAPAGTDGGGETRYLLSVPVEAESPRQPAGARARVAASSGVGPASVQGEPRVAESVDVSALVGEVLRRPAAQTPYLLSTLLRVTALEPQVAGATGAPVTITVLTADPGAPDSPNDPVRVTLLRDGAVLAEATAEPFTLFWLPDVAGDVSALVVVETTTDGGGAGAVYEHTVTLPIAAGPGGTFDLSVPTAHAALL